MWAHHVSQRHKTENLQLISQLQQPPCAGFDREVVAAYKYRGAFAAWGTLGRPALYQSSNGMMRVIYFREFQMQKEKAGTATANDPKPICTPAQMENQAWDGAVTALTEEFWETVWNMEPG